MEKTSYRGNLGTKFLGVLTSKFSYILNRGKGIHLCKATQTSKALNLHLKVPPTFLSSREEVRNLNIGISVPVRYSQGIESNLPH